MAPQSRRGVSARCARDRDLSLCRPHRGLLSRRGLHLGYYVHRIENRQSGAVANTSPAFRRYFVGDLARLEAISPSRYSELFRRLTGNPPIDYIISLRHAVSLLETTNLPVGEVAATVGFPDVHFFSKLFKKHVKMTPSKYRRMRKAPGRIAEETCVF